MNKIDYKKFINKISSLRKPSAIRSLIPLTQIPGKIILYLKK
jgi:hypothetical protein